MYIKCKMYIVLHSKNRSSLKLKRRGGRLVVSLSASLYRLEVQSPLALGCGLEQDTKHSP